MQAGQMDEVIDELKQSLKFRSNSPTRTQSSGVRDQDSSAPATPSSNEKGQQTPRSDGSSPGDVDVVSDVGTEKKLQQAGREAKFDSRGSSPRLPGTAQKISEDDSVAADPANHQVAAPQEVDRLRQCLHIIAPV